jgi:hypothetical protein
VAIKQMNLSRDGVGIASDAYREIKLLKALSLILRGYKHPLSPLSLPASLRLLSLTHSTWPRVNCRNAKAEQRFDRRWRLSGGDCWHPACLPHLDWSSPLARFLPGTLSA